MKKWFIVGVLLLLVLLVWAQVEKMQVNRPRGILREGPGSYFPAIAELPQGTQFEVLTEEGGWFKIKVAEYTGFLSKKATQGSTQSESKFFKLGEKRSIENVSQMGVSAGVKGFSGKFAHSLKGKTNFLEIAYHYHIDPKEYKHFRKNTYRDQGVSTRWIQRKNKLPRQEREMFFSFSEEGMGYGIASRFAGLGIMNTPQMQTYINFVANLVLEASDAYDLGIKVFILDHAAPNAFACPGGLIFVTRGMLNAIETETELACVLAHEIVHVVYKHGMQEMEERKTQIIADDAFAEMDQSMDEAFETTDDDEKYDALNKEMEAEALQLYERIFARRIAAYEREADQLGLLMALRAGYDPRQMLNLLSRIQQMPDLEEGHYDMNQVVERMAFVRDVVANFTYPDHLLNQQQRYQKEKSLWK